MVPWPTWRQGTKNHRQPSEVLRLTHAQLGREKRFHDLKTRIDTQNPAMELHYWRSTSQFEVDFILGDHTAIEVKATTSVSSRDMKGLKALAEERCVKRFIRVFQEPTRRKIADILVLPIQKSLAQLWSDAFVE